MSLNISILGGIHISIREREKEREKRRERKEREYVCVKLFNIGRCTHIYTLYTYIQ